MWLKQGKRTARKKNELILSKFPIGSFSDSFHFSRDQKRSKMVPRQMANHGRPEGRSIRHNQFLFELPSKGEANRVKSGEWFWNGRRHMLEWWSPVKGMGMTTAKSKERWIRAIGTPLHAWTTEMSKYIGGICGGFIGIDENTKHRVHLYWQHIYVKNRERDLRNIDLVYSPGALMSILWRIRMQTPDQSENLQSPVSHRNLKSARNCRTLIPKG